VDVGDFLAMLNGVLGDRTGGLFLFPDPGAGNMIVILLGLGRLLYVEHLRVLFRNLRIGLEEDFPEFGL
jgi:hypothetical protein